MLNAVHANFWSGNFSVSYTGKSVVFPMTNVQQENHGAISIIAP